MATAPGRRRASRVSSDGRAGGGAACVRASGCDVITTAERTEMLTLVASIARQYSPKVGKGRGCNSTAILLTALGKKIRGRNVSACGGVVGGCAPGGMHDRSGWY